ncbi:SH3 domain-containing protein [Leptospira perdikensis]|uniref:SH3 domain-containing protein n=1 Tax=Leptospira perdikensis TaxID=2484948 RepID=A0A4R9JHM9_9LEPT|nr:SH3 domain-containing protein [Leptospira perdikensis]TGL44383.1 SH3 domain-containing protein [Leptospira perdikensis]
MKKTLFLVFLFLLDCNKPTETAFSGEKSNPISPPTKQEEEIDKLCVNAESGLRIRDQPTTDSEKINLIPYQTILPIYEFSREYTKIGNVEARWAKVKFNDRFGWAFEGFLSWDCHDHGINQGQRITNKDLVGRWWDPSNKDTYYIEFSEYGVYSAYFFGGCDEGGCNSDSESGEWQFKHNFIYMKAGIHKFKAPISYIYYIENGKLESLDSEHSILENYSSESISGWVKGKAK